MEQIDRPTTYMRCTVGLLILLTTVLLVWASPAAAGTINVGKGTADSCTASALYEAVELARASGGGVIRFRCGSSPVTIVLNKGILSIPDNTKINGGHMVTVASTFHPGGLIQTEPGSIVVIANLSLANSPGAAILLNQGTLAFNSSALIGNHGNGIINWGTLTINDGTVVGNGGDSGCVIDNSLPFPVPVLTVMNSRFSQNTSIPICNGGTATVSGSSFSGNSSPGGGGAIFNAGTLTVGDSLFVDNHASAIVNSGTATVSTSLFYGQSINWSAIVNLSGGALTIESSTLQKNFAPVGAAVYNEGTLTIRSSTISANTAVWDGGGIYTCCGGTLTLESSVVTGNTPNDVVP